MGFAAAAALQVQFIQCLEEAKFKMWMSPYPTHMHSA